VTIRCTLTRKELDGGNPAHVVYDVMEDADGGIWLGFYQGELSYSESGGAETDWRVFTRGDGLLSSDEPRIAQTRDGTIWAISNHGDGELNRYDGRTWSVVRPPAPWTTVNTSLIVTRDGTLWVGGFQLSVFDGKVWRVFAADDLPIPYHRTHLLETRDGALWIAGLGEHVARVHRSSRRWLTYDELHLAL
jgi:ligand-binding sensor domain-containing protein